MGLLIEKSWNCNGVAGGSTEGMCDVAIGVARILLARKSAASKRVDGEGNTGAPRGAHPAVDDKARWCLLSVQAGDEADDKAGVVWRE